MFSNVFLVFSCVCLFFFSFPFTLQAIKCFYLIFMLGLPYPLFSSLPGTEMPAPPLFGTGMPVLPHPCTDLLSLPLPCSGMQAPPSASVPASSFAMTPGHPGAPGFPRAGASLTLTTAAHSSFVPPPKPSAISQNISDQITASKYIDLSTLLRPPVTRSSSPRAVDCQDGFFIIHELTRPR